MGSWVPSRRDHIKVHFITLFLCTHTFVLLRWMGSTANQFVLNFKIHFWSERIRVISMRALLCRITSTGPVLKISHHILHWKCHYATMAPYFTSDRSNKLAGESNWSKAKLRTWKCHLISPSLAFTCTQRSPNPLHLSVTSKLSTLTETQNCCKYLNSNPVSEQNAETKHEGKQTDRHSGTKHQFSYLNENTEW